MVIDKTIKNRKTELLSYFRDRASEALTAIKTKFAETQADKRARAINESLNQSKSVLITTLLQKAENENWPNIDKLECILMITYCNIVVMIESRNSVRQYEYMDFSRRVGELWDPFCKLCFYYPINNLSLFIPPLFSEVKKKLSDYLFEKHKNNFEWIDRVDNGFYISYESSNDSIQGIYAYSLGTTISFTSNEIRQAETKIRFPNL